MTRLALFLRRTRRAVLARRRLLAAGAAAGAVAAAVQASSAPPPPRTLVLAAAHDLAAGTVVQPADLTRVAFAPGTVPSGALPSKAAALGRTTASPVRAGEPLTDVRLLGGSLLDAYPGSVAAPVRIGDPGAVRLLKVGDRVDVIASDPQTGEATTVAGDAPVIALPQTPDEGSAFGAPGSMVSGGLVVLAVPEPTARALAGASVGSYLSVAIRN
ncbi:MAG TPA: SAF domain-containing protein [Nocardioidaceae bacterium]|jgi:Flp pilus assembly protein CpaB